MNGFKIILIFGLGLLCFCFTVEADNPVTWNYNLETPGNPCWHSPTFIDPWHSAYEYSWEITSSEVKVYDTWYGGPSGCGTGTTGPLPFSNLLVYHIDEPEIEADIFVSANASGYVDICIDNIMFGTVTGGHPVSGMRCSGNVTITPEPATIVFTSMGLLALLRRKKL